MRVSWDKEEEAVWRVRLSPGSAGESAILIDRRGVAELTACLEEAGSSPVCRVLVFEGACSGMDLESLLDPEERRDLDLQVGRFADCLRRLRGCDKVVIAVVDGDAAGGGVGIAAAADLLIATARSSFGLPELVLGLLPALVLPILHQRMPPAKALQLCMAGVSVEAAQAQQMGLVDQVVEEPAQLEKALRRAIKQSLRLNPEAVAELKGLQQEVVGLSCSDALDTGARRTARIFADAARVAVARSFLEGETPPWFDRYRPRRTRSR